MNKDKDLKWCLDMTNQRVSAQCQHDKSQVCGKGHDFLKLCDTYTSNIYILVSLNTSELRWAQSLDNNYL